MNTSSHIAEVTRQDFDALVLQRSGSVPVLVDFWAAWCGPCQMLMPLLAKLAQEYEGRFFLAKVNTDNERELAAQYGIRSLPTVKLFRNGAAVDGFMGVQPESAIRQLLERHLPRESDAALSRALADYEAGQVEQALTALREIRRTDPANHAATLALARALLEQGAVDEGESLLRSLPPDKRDEPEARSLMARLEFARAVTGAPELASLQKQVADHPEDCQARYWLAARYVLNGDHEAALEQLLEIVKRDRSFNDDAGRKGMLAVFRLLGDKGELVNRYRQQLASAIS